MTAISVAIFLVSAQWNLLAVQMAGAGLREGDRVECMIRPECIRIREISNPTAAPLTGTVRRTTFLGSVVEYEAFVERLGSLMVQASNPLEGKIHTVGSSVESGFTPESVHILSKID